MRCGSGTTRSAATRSTSTTISVRPRGRRGGQQFTLIGNAVVAPAKWGITIHNTHFGLVRDNVVYNSRGASIVTEDGNESFNVFDHNFAVRSQGAGDAVPRGGYGGGGSDPGSEGSAFWFSGPNNYVRNNVAANADSFGFSLAGPAGEMRVPGAAGADMLRAAETRSFDPVSAPVLEFSNNEAYGAMQIGVDCNWNGVISNVTVWHAARNGLVGMPASRLVIDGLVARGEPAILADAQENPSGVWLGNYIGREIIVRNADVEGMRTGVSSPFVSGPLGGGRSREPGSVVIEQSRFRNYFGVVVGTAYAPAAPGGRPRSRRGRAKLVVRAAARRAGQSRQSAGRHLDELPDGARRRGAARADPRPGLQQQAGRDLQGLLLARRAAGSRAVPRVEARHRRLGLPLNDVAMNGRSRQKKT